WAFDTRSMRSTRAPISDRIRPASGTGPMPANSMMRNPASGPDFASDCVSAGIPADLAWGHADRAVQPDRLAVEHLVLDDMGGQCAIFGRFAETGREGHLLAERILRFLRQTGKHGCAENAGGNCAHADAGAGKIASDRQRHADDSALGGG